MQIWVCFGQWEASTFHGCIHLTIYTNSLSFLTEICVFSHSSELRHGQIGQDLLYSTMRY